MAIVQLSYAQLLEEISEKLGIEAPQCTVTLVGEGWFLACIEFEVMHAGSVVEAQRCWGGPSRDIQGAAEEASCFTIQKMKSKFGLEIKDVNYEDYILYKDMYSQVTVQYANLLTNFNNLDREHNTLKDCYATTVAQNAAFVVEQVKMRSKIDEYHATVNYLRRGCSVSSVEPSEESSAS